MMQNNNVTYDLLEIISSETTEEFIKKINSMLHKYNIYAFRIWDVRGNVCEPCAYIPSDLYATFDIYELGYKGQDCSSNININISYFDVTYSINTALFLRHNNRVTHVITFEHKLHESIEAMLIHMTSYFGKRAVELFSKERQMDLYIDYQKKVDFVKRASIIFMALEIEEVISMSLNFFMEVFSADAVCVYYNDKFYGIGLEESDLDENITISDIPLGLHLKNMEETIYIEHDTASSKFNIRNVFLIHDNTAGLNFALFNIMVDIVPDKDFSSLVSSIVSIAAKNALNHEEITKFKIEETEIEHTAEILNKFVKKNIMLPNHSNIYGISYPARNAGGDFVNMLKTGDDYIFCVADVCGKGYSAAVLTVVLSVFMSNFSNSAELVKHVINMNEFLISKNFSDRFITSFFGIYHTNSHELEYISCGHDPAAVICPGGKIEYLTSDYMPMGIMSEEYKSKKVKVEEGSIIFVYTDGLIEYSSLDDLLCLVNALSNKTPKDIAEDLYNELVTDTTLQRDDFTCLIMKV